MKHPLVTIIILNWNGWEDTIECLESVYQINYPNYQIILVDNHSQDQSLQKIKEYTQGKIQPKTNHLTYNPHNKPLPLTTYTHPHTPQQTPPPNHLILIKNQKNYGFAKGNNIAIQYALQNLKPDYILLLNNDTIVQPNFLTNLVEVCEEHEQIGLAGPVIYYYEVDGRRDVVANLGGMVDLSHYPGYYDLKDVSRLQDYDSNIINCDWVSGAALLMKTKDIPLKFLDDKLFFGCEDIDLAIKLKEKGYHSAVVKDALIWHKEAVSRRRRSSDAAKRAFMEIRSNLTFLKAHNPLFYLYLPLYLFQILKIYLKVIIGRE